MTRDKKLELWETLATISWFGLFVSAQVFEWPIVVGILIVVALLSGLMIFAYIEKTSSNVLSIFAVNLWLVSYVFWILADMFQITTFYTKFTACVGFLFLLTVIFMNLGLRQYIFLELYKFRIFRIFKTSKNGDGVNDKIR